MSSIGDPTLDPLRPPEAKSGPGWARFTGTESPEEVEAMMADAFAPVRAMEQALHNLGAAAKEETVLVQGAEPYQGPKRPRFLRSAKTGTIHYLAELDVELGRPISWRTLCPSGRLISGELLDGDYEWQGEPWCRPCGEAMLAGPVAWGEVT